jgi:hypothetical protein
MRPTPIIEVKGGELVYTADTRHRRHTVGDFPLASKSTAASAARVRDGSSIIVGADIPRVQTRMRDIDVLPTRRCLPDVDAEARRGLGTGQYKASPSQ